MQVGRARRDAGMTLRELADRIGVSHAYVFILEIGRNPKTKRPSKPSSKIVRALANELRLDVDELLVLAGFESVTLQFQDRGAGAYAQH